MSVSRMSRRFSVVLASVALALAGASAARATTYTWTAGNGDWHEPANWSPSGEPGVGDVAIVDTAVTITFDTSAFVSTFKMSNGVLDGSANFGTSALEWSGGVMRGSGLTILNGTVSITGTVTLVAHLMILNGNTTLSGNSYIDFESGAQIINNGTFLFANDGGGEQGFLGGSGTYGSNGSTRKLAGNTGTTVFDIQTVSSGGGQGYQVLSGTMRFRHDATTLQDKAD